MLRKAVEVKGLSVEYEDTLALKNVTFDLDKGELLLILGPSGSGKSTLLKTLAGIIPHVVNAKVRGNVRIMNINPIVEDPLKLSGLISYIPQEPWDGILTHSVYSELCINALLYGIKQDRIVKSIKEFHLENMINRLTYTLSAGEVQRLVIASSDCINARIYLLDEPSSFLDENSRNSLIKYISKLLDNESTVVVVDHDVDLWKSLISKVLILDKGVQKYYGSFIEKAEEYAMKSLTSKYKVRKVQGDEILLMNNIWFRYPGSSKYVIKGFNLELFRGEFVVLVGPNGSGKTTLLKIASRILKPNRGNVLIKGRAIYIPENPLLYFSEPVVYDEVVIHAKDQSYGEELLRKLNLFHLSNKPIRKLSSGERRRVTLASALARGFNLICIDEITAGLDPYNTRLVIEAICESLDEGVSILGASHDKRLITVTSRTLMLG